MRIKRGTPVKIRTFLSKTFSKEDRNTIDDYWKLIGLCGIVIEEDNKGKVLVKFKKDLDDYHVANHDPIKKYIMDK
jgi:hypothetical protein